jgi:hypothetical protein
MLQNPETKKKTKKVFMKISQERTTSVDRKQRSVSRFDGARYSEHSNLLENTHILFDSEQPISPADTCPLTSDTPLRQIKGLAAA